MWLPRASRHAGARALAVLVLLCVAGLAGCLGDTDGAQFATPERPRFEGGRAVVAVVDTGVNPYHERFRAPAGWTPLATLPSQVVPLSLTFDAPSLQAALDADRAVWAEADGQVLHTVPGTRIAGLIAFGQPDDTHPDAPLRAPGLDEVGHGTAAASMVLDACPRCDLVIVEVADASRGRAAMRWLHAQDWIDVVVYPARAGVGFVGAGVHTTGDGTFTWGRNNVEAGQVVVAAAGNGHPDVTGTGLTTAYTPARDLSYSYWTAGPDWILTVGAVGPTGAASAWHTYPVDVVAPGLDCLAAHAFSKREETRFDGTSCSAPTVAGQVGSVLVETRHALGDGGTGPRSGQRLVVPEDIRHPAVTREDLTRAFLLGAGPVAGGTRPVEFQDPMDPATWQWTDGPLSPVHAGWGVHDADTLAAVVAVLAGVAEPPGPDDREAAWFPVDRRLRLSAWGGWEPGGTRIDFPEALDVPVRAPEAPAEVTRLYQASLSGPAAPSPVPEPTGAPAT